MAQCPWARWETSGRAPVGTGHPVASRKGQVLEPHRACAPAPRRHPQLRETCWVRHPERPWTHGSRRRCGDHRAQQRSRCLAALIKPNCLEPLTSIVQVPFTLDDCVASECHSWGTPRLASHDGCPRTGRRTSEIGCMTRTSSGVDGRSQHEFNLLEAARSPSTRCPGARSAPAAGPRHHQSREPERAHSPAQSARYHHSGNAPRPGKREWACEIGHAICSDPGSCLIFRRLLMLLSAVHS
jgi:hypothetical protein